MRQILQHLKLSLVHTVTIERRSLGIGLLQEGAMFRFACFKTLLGCRFFSVIQTGKTDVLVVIGLSGPQPAADHVIQIFFLEIRIGGIPAFFPLQVDRKPFSEHSVGIGTVDVHKLVQDGRLAGHDPGCGKVHAA